MSHGKAAARDLRHGRRGGGWIEESTREPSATGVNTELANYVCAYCGHKFRGHVPSKPNEEKPTHCGRALCTALHEWTPERWLGQVRMAEARAAAGSPLDDFDHEAFRRSGRNQ